MPTTTLQDKKFYLTVEGLEKIKREFEELKTLRLAKTRGEVPKMMQSEDVDTEYLSFQEDMELLENKLQYLEKILKNYEIIKVPASAQKDTVYLGTKVSLQDAGGNKVNFEIVGTLEADPFEGRISNESPVGRALIGKKTGETVSVNGQTSYKVLKVARMEA